MWKVFCGLLLLGLFLHISSMDEDMLHKTKPLGKCNDTLIHPQGSFHLSNFSAKYDCFFYITPNKTEIKNQTAQISLFIESLILHEKDTVTIYKDELDAINMTNALFGPLTAQNGSITIYTEEPTLVIRFHGTEESYVRNFNGFYHDTVCTFALHRDIRVMHSPVVAGKVNATEVNCKYTFSTDLAHRTVPTFTFEQFTFNKNPVSISVEPKFDDHSVDFLLKENGTKSFDMTVQFNIPTNETFILRMQNVDSMCSEFKILTDQPMTVESPSFELNNGTITNECRWIFEQNDPSQILSIEFEEVVFDSVQDIISVNDGGSELSPPMLQVTASNQNTSNMIVRSSKSHLWVSFKPVSYLSKMKATVYAHKQGGHWRNNGTIQMNGDKTETVYQLEVENNQLVFLNFTDTKFQDKAVLNIYDGFDKTNLLATVSSPIWYPILSKSSKMMIIASGFDSSSFKADFKGVSEGCMKMSSLSNQDYVLSGNCDSSCIWIIPPQNVKQSVLMLHLQFLALEPNDTIEMAKLDAAKTSIGNINASTNHVPQIVIPANVGAIVEVKRKDCKKPADVILVGHSSYIPDCNKELTFTPGSTFQLSSPLYPDTYPIFTKCKWTITTPKESLIHLTFHTLKLAKNHCIRINGSVGNVTLGPTDVLPDDMFLTGGSVAVEFDSTNCGGKVADAELESSEGFLINATVTDCGAVMSGKPRGEFTSPNKTLCMWKVDVPGGSPSGVVDIASYSVSKKDEKGNYDLVVYDGASVRDTAITNNSNAEIWAKTNSLIFVYTKIDPAKSASNIVVKFNSIACNQSMQCDNKLCLHPDWRCNGINECGDFTDERNCNAVPIPPEKPSDGYSSAVFWTTVFIMLGLGVAVGILVPTIKEKISKRRYARFGDISDIN